MNKLEEILEEYTHDEILKADGFDDAVIAIEDSTMRLVYSIPKILAILVKEQGMDHSEAREYMDFNITGSYVGPQTPIYVVDEFDS